MVLNSQAQNPWKPKKMKMMDNRMDMQSMWLTLMLKCNQTIILNKMAKLK